MINSRDYKPIVNELIDLMNQQKNLALNLFLEAKSAKNDREFLDAMRDYLSSIDDQAEALEKVARMTEVSFENAEFAKLDRHR